MTFPYKSLKADFKLFKPLLIRNTFRPTLELRINGKLFKRTKEPILFNSFKFLKEFRLKGISAIFASSKNSYTCFSDFCETYKVVRTVEPQKQLVNLIFILISAEHTKL